MKSIARTVLAVAVLFSAAAQASFGTIGVANTDAVTTSVSGSSYASVRWVVTIAGTATVTTEYTSDGVNWKVPPYSTRVDAVSANPSTQPWQNAAPLVGSFETPIPANTLGFRVRCGTVGTLTSVSVNPGIIYVPGSPVMATLWDTTAAFTVAIDTGTLDTSGWASMTAYLANNDTGGVSRPLLVVPKFPDGATMPTGALSVTVNSGAGGAASQANGGAASTSALVNLAARTQVTVGVGTGTGGSARLVVQVRR